MKIWSSALVKQSLSSHSWLGLFSGGLIYLVCLTGTLVVFSDELKRWEAPYVDENLSYEPVLVEKAINEFLLSDKLEDETLSAVLPSPTLPRTILYTGESSDVFYGDRAWLIDAKGSISTQSEQKWTGFLLYLHFYLGLPATLGTVVVGILGTLLIALIVSGFFSYPRIFRDAFRLRLTGFWRLRFTGFRRLEQADIHNRLSVWGAPFHLMIAITGAYFGLAAEILPVVADAFYAGDIDAVDGSVYGEAPELQGQTYPVAVATALESMKSIAPEAAPFRIDVYGAGDPYQSLSISATYHQRLVFEELYQFDSRGAYVDSPNLANGSIGRQVMTIRFLDHPRIAEGLAYLRQDLIRHDYSPTGSLAPVFSWDGVLNINRWLPPKLGANAPLDWLVRFFQLNREMDKTQLEACLSSAAIAALQECRMIEVSNNMVKPQVGLVMCCGLYFLCDLDDIADTTYWVMAPEESSALVADYLLDELKKGNKKKRVLGTGTGCLALLAAAHGAEAIGIDANARAIEFARFNAHLNQLSATFAVSGEDVYDQLPPGEFDLIAFNFPGLYDMGPTAIACSIGPADEFISKVYQGLPRLLAPDGVALFRQDVPRIPEPYFEDLLRSTGCHEHLRVAWLTNSDHFMKLPRLETGLAMVTRTSSPAEVFFRRVPWWKEQYRPEIDRFFRSMQLLEKGQLDVSCPRPFDYIVAHRPHALTAAGFVEQPRVLIAADHENSRGLAYDASVFEVLRHCDGKTPGAAIIQALPHIDVRGIIGDLVRKAVVVLEDATR